MFRIRSTGPCNPRLKDSFPQRLARRIAGQQGWAVRPAAAGPGSTSPSNRAYVTRPVSPLCSSPQFPLSVPGGLRQKSPMRHPSGRVCPVAVQELNSIQQIQPGLRPVRDVPALWRVHARESKNKFRYVSSDQKFDTLPGSVSKVLDSTFERRGA